MMNKQGRPTTGTAHGHTDFATISGNRGLDHEEPLLFELGRPGKCGVDLPEPELDHAEREIAHAGLIVGPGEQPPEAEILLAQRDLAAMLVRVQPKKLRIGIGLAYAGGVIHHAADSAGSGLSSGSTSTSSSSPR